MSTSNAFATVEALRIVLREEQPPAMAEVLCDMERARMTAEDYRGAVLSPYPAGCHTTDSHQRLKTWKEFGKERNRRCDHVTFNVIEPATEALEQMRRDMRLNCAEALETAHNEICRIQSILREEDEETSEDDEETSDDDGIRCIVCETVSSPDWFNIVPAGSLPDVAPGTRIVCGSCYAANPAIGEVDSFF